MFNRSLGQALFMAQLAAGIGGDIFPEPKERKVKKCLNCGEDHTHNNVCCSAECFKEWKSKK